LVRDGLTKLISMVLARAHGVNGHAPLFANIRLAQLKMAERSTPKREK